MMWPNMIIVDTHCHLDLKQFAEDRDAVIQRALAADVRQIVVPAINLENCPAVLALAEQYESVFAAVGVHPNDTAVWQDKWIDQLREMAQHPKVVAIGEIGLDYYWNKAPKTIQHRALNLQLALADELDLPVILHNRDSSEDMIQLLAEAPISQKAKPGVLHSFSGDLAMARQALAWGYYLGFTGPVTFKKAEALRELILQIPQDRLLVETDAPYLTPQPYRGKRNEPGYVAFVVERIAALFGVETAVMADITTQNARRLFTKLPAN